MNDHNHDQDLRGRMVEMLSAGTEAELQLLRKERKAERRLANALDTLADDKARLKRAQQQLERSREAVATAEADLRAMQESRAEGPARPQD